MIPAALAPLASHLWQSTLFAAAAGLLTLALRRNQARVRYWLWLAASCKFLLPFSWLVSIGQRFEWRSAPAIIPHTFSTVTDVVTQPPFLAAISGARLAPPEHTTALLFVIGAAWACGFVAVAAGWTREWLRIRAIMREASPLQLDLPVGKEGEILRPPRRTQNDSAKPQAIRVMSTRARLEPGVIGIFRPVLLLPEGIAARLTQGQLQSILAHELAHVRRRDNLTAAVHMLVEALFWFYPLVWWLGARLIDERERACDEEVLQSGGHAQVYAESILKVCEFYLESRLTCVSGITGSDLKKRVGRIMRNHIGERLSEGRKLCLAAAGIATLAVPLITGVLTAPRLRAQILAGNTPAADWQAAAGNKAQFDVASVKQDHDGRVNSNFPMGLGDSYSANGGLFSATYLSVATYIGFAYKLTPYQTQSLQTLLPKWANEERFDIQARAGGNPTKDQMRLMMQSLLMNRFKLAVHRETQEGKVFALVVVNAGKPGPQLRPHTSDSEPCGGFTLSPSAKLASGFPVACDVFLTLLDGDLEQTSARNVTLGMIAGSLPLPGMGTLDRPVVDQTGLRGTFDFSIKWVPDSKVVPNVQGVESGPSFQEALQDQLGLKLKSTTGQVDTLFIDHIEEPSAN